MAIEDPGWVAVAIDAAQFACTSAVGIYVWLSGKDRARASTLVSLRDDIDKHLALMESRLQHIEAEHRPGFTPNCIAHNTKMATIEEGMRHAPSTGDLARVHQRIDGHAEALAELRGGVTRIERQLEIISQHLLNSP